MKFVESVIGLFLLLLLVIVFLVCLGLVIFYYIGAWNLFNKCGQDGWKVLIPFYGRYVFMVEICDMNAIYFIFSVLLLIFSCFKSFLLIFMGKLDFISSTINSGSINVLYVLEVVSWLVLIFSYIIAFASYYNLSKKFNKNVGWVILTFFFDFFTIPILGLSKKSVYTDVEVSEHSLFGSINK